jgi:ribosomal 50S subunit-recycling heat shock protein
VTANGRPAKASYDVKVGDVLEITFGARTLRIRVLEVKDTVGKDAASSLYEVIES